MLGVRPLRPDVHAPCPQIRFVRVARQKPEQFFRDPPKWDSFGRNDRKSIAQIEARLIAEVGNRSYAGAIPVLFPVGENRLE
jgi:hypothetical protein